MMELMPDNYKELTGKLSFFSRFVSIEIFTRYIYNV